MADGPIFISYASEDQDFAYELVRGLEGAGNRVWIAPRDVRPGNYPAQLHAAIHNAAAFVIILTKASNNSKFVQAETEMAFSKGLPIFPVRPAPIMPSDNLALFLQMHHWTDAFGSSRHSAIGRLARELQALRRGGRGGAGGRTVPPPEPEPTAPDPSRSRAGLALALAGCGALLVCLLLVLQPGSGPAANSGMASTNGGNAATPAVDQPNMAPVSEDIARHQWVEPPEDPYANAMLPFEANAVASIPVPAPAPVPVIYGNVTNGM